MATISAVIITYNEAANIRRCLESLEAVADEIVVVDAESSDETEAICKSRNISFYTNKFISFSDQKNYANKLASCDYILSIDADECLSQELIHSLLTVKKDMKYGGYVMNRRSSYAGKWIRTCGWYPDVKLRIWKRGNGVWEGQGVHEKMKLKHDRSIFHLEGDILHHAYDDINQFLEKIRKYSDIYAHDQRFKAKASTLKIFYKTFFTFTKSYFFQGGIADGYKGLLISVCNANHTFYKYVKLKEANNQLNISLIISTYNREDALEASLLSALNQSQLPNEIIVADDGSGEKTKKLIDSYRKKSPIPIRHCWHEDQGFRLSVIRNKAMAMAKSEYIISIDGDIIMHRHFIRSHKINAKSNQMIQGSRVLLDKRTTTKWLNSQKRKLGIFGMTGGNRLNAIYSPILSKIISSRNKNLQRVRGANMSFWKKDLIRVNGFNEDFVGWGREDSELVARIYNAGIVCKRLKFMGFGYHLHHSERSRNSLSQNDSILEDTVIKKLSRCERGIDRYALG